MAELKIILTAETEDAAKKVENFSDKAEKGLGDISKIGVKLDKILEAIERNTIEAAKGFDKLSVSINKVKATGGTQGLADTGKNIEIVARAADRAKGPLKALSVSGESLSKSFLQVGETLIPATKAITDLPKAIPNVTGKVKPLSTEITGLASTVRGSLIPSLARLSGPAAIGAVAVGFLKATPIVKSFFDASERADSFRTSLVEAGLAAFKFQQDFGTISKIFNDTTSSTNAQNSALKGLNLELRKYNFVLKDAATAAKVSGEVGAILAQIRKEEAFQTAINAQAAAAYARSLNLQILATDKTAAGFAKYVKELGIFETIIGVVTAKAAGFNGVQQFTAGAAFAAAEETARLAVSQNKYGEAADKSEFAVKGLVEQLGKIKGIQIQRDFDGAAKAADGLGKAAKEAERPLKILTTQMGDLVKSSSRALDSVRLIQDAVNRFSNEKVEAAKRSLEQLVRIVNQGVSSNVTTQGRGPNSQVVNAFNDANNKAADLQDRLDNIANFAAGTLTQTLDAAFSAIANGESPIKAITNSLKALITRLVAAAAAAAILSALLPGGSALAAGASSKFGNIFGKLLGLSTGGLVFGPTPALIGDNGPEAVIPLSQLAALTGNGNGGRVDVNGVIRGNDIFITNQRGNQSYGRLFG